MRRQARLLGEFHNQPPVIEVFAFTADEQRIDAFLSHLGKDAAIFRFVDRRIERRTKKGNFV